MDNSKKAHIIVVSNEKGGTGKSTISMHLAIKLLQEGNPLQIYRKPPELLRKKQIGSADSRSLQV